MEDLGVLALVVALGLIIVVGGYLAGLIRVPSPLVLLVLGAAIGFVPAFRDVGLPPELVLLLFLPPLLYWESLNTSLREIRANLRVILLQAIVLVLVTAAVVAVIAHAFGMPWAVAIALGAILAPTDATAVAGIRVRLPRRAVTILRVESLINDGTALVIYAIAVEAVVSGDEIRPFDASVQFVLSYAGAIAIGAVTVALVIGIRRIVKQRALLAAISVLTPYLAYLPAEFLHVSGVVAVVTAGLGLWQFGLKNVTASARTEAFAFWRVASYLLNATLFTLIGIELHNAVDGIGAALGSTLLIGLCVAASVMLTRIAWSNTTPYVIRAIDRRPAQRARRVGARQRLPLAWAGFRGAVSLAAALALPTETADGEPFPFRDAIIGITFVVIFVTLLLQGLTLERIVRWARFPADPREFDERLLAEQTLARAALDAIPEVAERLGSPEQIRAGVESDIRSALNRIHRDDDDPSAARRDTDQILPDTLLRLALIPAKREALLALRNHQDIDDIVLRRVQERLDLEELRLRAIAEEDEPGE